MQEDNDKKQEQEKTQRVEGMVSAESVIASGPTQVSGYQPGQYIGGHYEVLELVGKGGMSLVYKVRHVLINDLRAIKILLSQQNMAADSRGLQRFQQEARLSMRLEHTNIVRTMEFSSPSDGPPFIVMDYIEGRSLEKELAVLKKFSSERAVKIVLQIADALAYIHAQNIIHRDLKPGNIILVADKGTRGRALEKIKLIDFGIARSTTEETDEETGYRLFTPTGDVLGSPQHMSPEQCAGLEVDERSDVYSLGCILYELLAGFPPIMGKNALDTLRLQASMEPRPLSKVVPQGENIGPLSQIVAKCLQKEPEDRYQSIEELKAALEKTTASTKPKTTLKLALAGGLSLSLAAFAAGYFLAPGKEQPVKTSHSGVSQGTAEAAIDESDETWRKLNEKGQKQLDEGNPQALATFEQAMNALGTHTAKRQGDSEARTDTAQDLEITRFTNYLRDPQDKFAPPLPWPEPAKNSRYRLAKAKLRDLGEDKKLSQNTYQNVLNSCLLDDDYVGIYLQSELVEKALELAKKNPEIRPEQIDLLNTLQALKRAQCGRPSVNGAPHAYFWNLKTQLNKMPPSEEKSQIYYLRGRFYQLENELKEAEKAYEDSYHLASKLHGDEDQRAVIGHVMEYVTGDSLEKTQVKRGERVLKQIFVLQEREAPPDTVLLLNALVYAQIARVNSNESANAFRYCSLAIEVLEKRIMRNEQALACLLNIKRDITKNLLKEKWEPALIYRAAALYLSHGNLPQAADLYEELARYYTSKENYRYRIRLLKLSLEIEKKLEESGLGRVKQRREIETLLGELLADKTDNPYYNVQEALPILQKALQDSTEISNWDHGDDVEREDRKMFEYFWQAKLKYLIALAQFRANKADLAPSLLKQAKEDLAKNDAYLVEHGSANTFTAQYKQDKQDRAALLNSISVLERELNSLPKL